MAASYAALVSLSNILHQILNPPPTHHFIFPRERFEALLDKVGFLIHFLETSPSKRTQEFENTEARIKDAAHEAEDIIESDIVAQLQAKSGNLQEKNRVSTPIQIVLTAFDEGISEIIYSFTSIQKDLLAIKSRQSVKEGGHDYSKRSTSGDGGKNNVMVGFQEHMDRIRYQLASDDSNLLIVSIVGMGGIGKTTLARNVYIDPCITETFIRAWVPISQEFNVREAVITLLQQISSDIVRDELDTNDLGVLLHKELYGKRYLIVLDDMWDIQSWDKLRRFLAVNGDDGSRILVTTRLLELAEDFRSCRPHQMSLLDDKNSWNLIYEYVKEDCPIELEEIGRSIARGCGGLPLALVVIGGLLAKSEKSRGYWEYVEQNVSSTVTYADDKKCLEILRLSYDEMPLHLKPCFLYLAMFPKTIEIRVSRLVRLWVAEGFIKAREGKTLEEAAEGYVKDLYDRNLIMIGKRGRSGKVKTYHIHDVVRDLCMFEAHLHNFLCIVNLDHSKRPLQLESERRLSIHTSSTDALRLGPHNRSLLSYSTWESRRHVAHKLKLLRVLDVMDSYSIKEIMWLINSRYITCAIPRQFYVSSFISMLWNLQTLVFPGPISLPYEFWYMPQLRHLQIPGITLSDPLDTKGDNEKLIVLKNLHTLTTLRDFVFSENVLRRIPNLKKLGIDCDATRGIESFCLRNIALSLDKLESLVLKTVGTWENMTFPISLKKLTLSDCQIPWEDMTMVGSLPNLEVLKLLKCAAKGQAWSPNAGEFLRLKFLLIERCQLETWDADDSHFPTLEHLQLVGLTMEEFPVGFAQIATLRMIDMNYCSLLLFLSAKSMSKEREDFGFEDIKIRSFPLFLRIKVKRGIHLACYSTGSRTVALDSYVVIKMANQKLRTRIIRRNINPEWNHDLIFSILDPNLPILLSVHDHNALLIHENIGDAEFEIVPYMEALKQGLKDLPEGTIISKVAPSRSNCLSEESWVVWKDGKLVQDLCLRLRNVECGKVEIQLELIE